MTGGAAMTPAGCRVRGGWAGWPSRSAQVPVEPGGLGELPLAVLAVLLHVGVVAAPGWLWRVAAATATATSMRHAAP